jgi:hypothetical protein
MLWTDAVGKRHPALLYQPFSEGWTSTFATLKQRPAPRTSWPCELINPKSSDSYRAQLYIYTDKPLTSLVHHEVYDDRDFFPVLHWDGPWMRGWYSFSVSASLMASRDARSREFRPTLEAFRDWWHQSNLKFYRLENPLRIQCRALPVAPHIDERVVAEWDLERLDERSVWMLVEREHEYRAVRYCFYSIFNVFAYRIRCGDFKTAWQPWNDGLKGTRRPRSFGCAPSPKISQSFPKNSARVHKLIQMIYYTVHAFA